MKIQAGGKTLGARIDDIDLRQPISELMTR